MQQVHNCRPPSFLTWLHDPEPGVATRTAALLAWFPQVPGLATALTGVGFDTDTARASANLALAFLPSPPSSRELAALTACLASTNEAVRVTAAVALAHRQTTALPDKALTVLIHADSDEVTGDSGPQQSADAERGASRDGFAFFVRLTPNGDDTVCHLQMEIDPIAMSELREAFHALHAALVV
ncbi:hypothetical protein OG713_45465 (plasmid) [Streptomyces sp. NBC_00723]|uniref:hypothetical protein n=1 Tax=Streptomyces sp. NBC_00723 TaxID=2903673 RepID=UPI0038651806